MDALYETKNKRKEKLKKPQWPVLPPMNWLYSNMTSFDGNVLSVNEEKKKNT